MTATANTITGIATSYAADEIQRSALYAVRNKKLAEMGLKTRASKRGAADTDEEPKSKKQAAARGDGDIKTDDEANKAAGNIKTQKTPEEPDTVGCWTASEDRPVTHIR